MPNVNAILTLNTNLLSLILCAILSNLLSCYYLHKNSPYQKNNQTNANLTYWCSDRLMWICYSKIHVTHWGRYKMDAILQTTFSYAFSWMKMYEYRLMFPWSLFQATSHYLDQWWLDYPGIYASLGLKHARTESAKERDIQYLINTTPVKTLQWIFLWNFSSCGFSMYNKSTIISTWIRQLYLIEVCWWLNVSMDWVVIGLDTGLPPVPSRTKP